MVKFAHDLFILLLDRAKVLILVILLLEIFLVERGQCIRLQHLELLFVERSFSSSELRVELGEETLVRGYFASHLLGPERALLGL